MTVSTSELETVPVAKDAMTYYDSMDEAKLSWVSHEINSVPAPSEAEWDLVD